MENMTTKQLLEIVDDLPVRQFGWREFETLQKAVKAEVADNYPDDMTVILITDEAGNTIELLYESKMDSGFKEPHFIG